MDVVSLGFRTDLALLERAGSTIEDCGDHLVVRSPANPTFYWGNFLLLDHVPAADRVEMWLERFVEALPAARHRSLGFDAPHASAADLAAFTEHGLEIDVSTVMTATSVHPPAHPNGDATYRTLESDADWSQSVELTLACNDEYEASRPPHVRRAAGGEQPRSRRGGSRRVVRGLPRRRARVADGARHGRPGAGAVPDRRDAPRAFAAAVSPARSCTTSAATASTRSEPRRS